MRDMIQYVYKYIYIYTIYCRYIGGFPNSHAWWHLRLPLLRFCAPCVAAHGLCAAAAGPNGFLQTGQRVERHGSGKPWKIGKNHGKPWKTMEKPWKTVNNWDWTHEKLGKTMENLKLSGEVFISENHHHHFYPRFPDCHSHLALDTQLHPLYAPNCPAELSKITCLYSWLKFNPSLIPKIVQWCLQSKSPIISIVHWPPSSKHTKSSGKMPWFL